MTTTITVRQADRIAAAFRARGRTRQTGAWDQWTSLSDDDREFWRADVYRALAAGDIHIEPAAATEDVDESTIEDPNKVTCPDCGRQIGVNRDGTLRRHNDIDGQACAGSGEDTRTREVAS